LTVQENLAVADRRGRWTQEAVFELFPHLAERRRNHGGRLSGGEQQMLAVGRALMGSPRLLLLDEPFEGLAPVVVDALMAALTRLRQETGMTMLVVEQHARMAVEMADRAILLERGRIRRIDSRAEMLRDWAAVEDSLAIG
jgi:branched-chain amino acid transport system ATP-binding protein